MPKITFSNVSVDFDGVFALKDINLELSEQRIGIIGENGGGKSTLTRLINGLGQPTQGTVTVDAKDVSKNGREIRKKVGFVFSDAENQIVMPKVWDDVAFSLRRLKLSTEERNHRVGRVLQRFDLTELKDRSPHTLSGGQKQLLALASVVVMDPEIIIADEPTTLLDLRNRDRIRREFSSLQQQLIVVTHDLDFLEDFERIICIDNHQVAADGSPPEVIPYYRQLISQRPY